MPHENLSVDSGNPPRHVERAGRMVSNNVSANEVRVENAVDNRWFVVARGSTDDVSEEEFEELERQFSLVVGSEPEAVRTSYGVGPYNNRYLLRAEY